MALQQESERGAITTARRSNQVGVSGYLTGELQRVLHTTMMRDGPEKFDRKVDRTTRPNVSDWQLWRRARPLTVA